MKRDQKYHMYEYLIYGIQDRFEQVKSTRIPVNSTHGVMQALEITQVICDALIIRPLYALSSDI